MNVFYSSMGSRDDVPNPSKPDARLTPNFFPVISHESKADVLSKVLKISKNSSELYGFDTVYIYFYGQTIESAVQHIVSDEDKTDFFLLFVAISIFDIAEKNDHEPVSE